jgi:hypothetical protein
MDTKTCTRCHLDKPVTEFYKDRGRYMARCKECTKAVRAEEYAAKPAEEKRRTPEQQEAHRLQVQKDRQRAREADPEGFRAERARKQRERRARLKAEQQRLD